MLMMRLFDKGITGKVWRVLRHAYQHMASCVKLAGRRSAHFPLTQGVAQGCPLSPVLFIIFMDSLLHDIHAHSASGISLEGIADVFCGQSFADDTVALSATGVASDTSPARPGLQPVIDALHAHSQAWDWSANVLKSKIMAFNASAEEPAMLGPSGPCPFSWGQSPLLTARTEKYLGVLVSADGSWAPHLAAKLCAGWEALVRWRPLLRNRRITCLAKLQVLRTYIFPRILYGLEVVTPASVADRRALTELSTLVHSCLYEVYGIAVGESAWRMQRCVKRDVLYLDSSCVTVLEALEVAHVRFAAKPLPPSSWTPGVVAASPPPAPSAGLTTRLRASLPVQHPWRRCVDATARRLLPGTPVAPPTAEAVPADHALLKTCNRDLTAAVHSERVQALLGGSTGVDHARGGSGTQPTRRSMRTRQQAGASGLQPLRRVLSTDGRRPPCAHCSETAGVALPFLALRSGHVLAEAQWPAKLLDDLQYPSCPCCQAPLASSIQMSSCDRPWFRAWHLLTRCDDNPNSLRNLEAFVCDQCACVQRIRAIRETLPVRAGGAVAASLASLDAHETMLRAVLRRARAGGPLCVEHLPLAEDFLAFLLDPIRCLQPPACQASPLLRSVSKFLWGCSGRAAPGQQLNWEHNKCRARLVR